jgi:hypothetical protein
MTEEATHAIVDTAADVGGNTAPQANTTPRTIPVAAVRPLNPPSCDTACPIDGQACWPANCPERDTCECRLASTVSKMRARHAEARASYDPRLPQSFPFVILRKLWPGNFVDAWHRREPGTRIWEFGKWMRRTK